MSYATLMVHVEAEQDSGKRIDLATDLADRFDAALIGVAGWSFRPLRLTGGPAAAAESSDHERREMQAILDQRGQAFRTAARQISDVEWRGILDYPSNLVPREARAADLVIIGRRWDPRDLFFSLDPGMAIIRAGRPVLVVPDAIRELRARRIVVAWKDTREARRAVCDALPFLQRAEEVAVVELREDGTDTAVQHPLEDIVNYLRRHHVVVGAKLCVPVNDSIAAALIGFAQSERSDLIVAGAYGHSRMGEWMFGGVTREFLSASPICCLFSH